eukprot:g2552.t1
MYRNTKDNTLLLRKIQAVVKGYGMSGATSALVRESLPKIGRKKYSESSVKRVLSENSSKWFGQKPFLRTQSVGPTGETRVSYVSQEFLNSRKPFGRCYLSGEKKFPYQILASRFSHTQKAMLFQAVMPLCLGESTLRKHISGRKRVVRTGVVVISLDSEEKRKKPSSSSSSSSSNSTTKSTVSKAKKENRSSVERKAKAETRKADETKSKEKKGFLQKRGGNIFRKSWHKRYVVLKEGSIYYYTSNRKNERCRGSYLINKSCTVQHTDKESSLDYPNTFKVKGRRFELIFAAKSALEEQSWIDCIRNVIKDSRSY